MPKKICVQYSEDIPPLLTDSLRPNEVDYLCGRKREIRQSRVRSPYLTVFFFSRKYHFWLYTCKGPFFDSRLSFRSRFVLSFPIKYHVSSQVFELETKTRCQQYKLSEQYLGWYYSTINQNKYIFCHYFSFSLNYSTKLLI